MTDSNHNAGYEGLPSSIFYEFESLSQTLFRVSTTPMAKRYPNPRSIIITERLKASPEFHKVEHIATTEDSENMPVIVAMSARMNNPDCLRRSPISVNSISEPTITVELICKTSEISNPTNRIYSRGQAI